MGDNDVKDSFMPYEIAMIIASIICAVFCSFTLSYFLSKLDFDELYEFKNNCCTAGVCDLMGDCYNQLTAWLNDRNQTIQREYFTSWSSQCCSLVTTPIETYSCNLTCLTTR